MYYRQRKEVTKHLKTKNLVFTFNLLAFMYRLFLFEKDLLYNSIYGYDTRILLNIMKNIWNVYKFNSISFIFHHWIEYWFNPIAQMVYPPPQKKKNQIIHFTIIHIESLNLCVCPISKMWSNLYSKYLMFWPLNIRTLGVFLFDFAFNAIIQFKLIIRLFSHMQVHQMTWFLLHWDGHPETQV